MKFKYFECMQFHTKWNIAGVNLRWDLAQILPLSWLQKVNFRDLHNWSPCMQPSLCWFHTIESKLLSCFHFSSLPLGIILGKWSQLEQEIIWNTSSNNSNGHVLKNGCSYTLHFSKSINDWMDRSYKAFYHFIAKQ